MSENRRGDFFDLHYTVNSEDVKGFPEKTIEHNALEYTTQIKQTMQNAAKQNYQ